MNFMRLGQLGDRELGDRRRPQLAALEQRDHLGHRPAVQLGLLHGEPIDVDDEERDVLAQALQVQLAVAVDVCLADLDEPAEGGEALGRSA